MLTAQVRQAADPGRDAIRRAGLVVRVSTDRQARTPEGSLKNQLQRLRQHLAWFCCS